MARSYPADTRMQKALEELYEKEDRARLSWFLHSQEKAITGFQSHHRPRGSRPANDLIGRLDNPQSEGPETAATSSKQMEQKKPDIQTEIVAPTDRALETDVKSVSTSVKRLLYEEIVAPTDRALETDVKSVSTNVKRLLYEGLSKEGKGRQVADTLHLPSCFLIKPPVLEITPYKTSLGS
ncbi:unnamed protein product [Protopolystoma xenopodis]|uniref:Uncharacterized protein n=1 Tax=Protopolystoma xenopodis TaxID=117903 RepID=A0A448XSP7_9PLAT|nr:unnamed protein product [Protopolystoma xenopodis]